MSSSAQSTVKPKKRAATLSAFPVVFVVTFLAPWSSEPPAIAQSDALAVTTDSLPSISVTDDIRRVREAYESTDDVPAAPVNPGAELAAAPAPRTILKTFLATAYCLKGQTASGVVVRRGIIAADPRVLPLGSVVRLTAGRYSGIYTVMDTGKAIRGRRIDIYLPTRSEAITFGAREVRIEVLRHGWDPGLDTDGGKRPSIR